MARRHKKRMSLAEKKIWRRLTGSLEVGDRVKILHPGLAFYGFKGIIRKIDERPGVHYKYRVGFSARQWQKIYAPEYYKPSFTLTFSKEELELIG